MHKPIVLLTALCGVAFVLALGTQLPAVVASHFGPSGQPDGSMSRTTFVGLMAVLVGLLPILIWWIQYRSATSGRANIAHREYWFAAERRESTHRWLSAHAAIFSVVTTVFLCFDYWLVVVAHRSPEVALPSGVFWTAVALYLVFTGGWAYALHARFRRTGAN